MREDSLLYFDNPDEMIIFIDKLDIYNGWKISKGTMNERGELIRNKAYSKLLRNIFSDKEAFRRKLSISETVSWLDSFEIMRRVILELRQNISKDIYTNIGIHFENIIKMSKKMRIDFIFEYNNQILLLEFRMVNDYTKIRSTWSKKKGELLVYKELMCNYIDDKVKILTFAFISMYEYENRNKIASHVNYNNNQVSFLVEYIQKFMINKDNLL